MKTTKEKRKILIKGKKAIVNVPDSLLEKSKKSRRKNKRRWVKRKDIWRYRRRKNKEEVGLVKNETA